MKKRTPCIGLLAVFFLAIVSCQTDVTATDGETNKGHDAVIEPSIAGTYVMEITTPPEDWENMDSSEASELAYLYRSWEQMSWTLTLNEDGTYVEIQSDPEGSKFVVGEAVEEGTWILKDGKVALTRLSTVRTDPEGRIESYDYDGKEYVRSWNTDASIGEIHPEGLYGQNIEGVTMLFQKR